MQLPQDVNRETLEELASAICANGQITKEERDALPVLTRPAKPLRPRDDDSATTLWGQLGFVAMDGLGVLILCLVIVLVLWPHLQGGEEPPRSLSPPSPPAGWAQRATAWISSLGSAPEPPLPPPPPPPSSYAVDLIVSFFARVERLVDGYVR